uniref:tRNA-splicing endonuclease subunit Sen15 domain-containing protein n=1 Tax=Meleagris gallopavo TaxID=9103 RepID=G1MRR6_MELGA
MFSICCTLLTLSSGDEVEDQCLEALISLCIPVSSAYVGLFPGGSVFHKGKKEEILSVHPFSHRHYYFTAMMSLDISDSSQIYAAFLVYLDLLEGRSWHEVKHVGLAELQLVCLHAREREQGDLQVMVPIPADVLCLDPIARRMKRRLDKSEQQVAIWGL